MPRKANKLSKDDRKKMASEHLCPSYMTVSEYARAKNISPSTVYFSIGSGKIVPVLIGTAETLFIDWSSYEHTAFNEDYKKSA